MLRDVFAGFIKLHILHHAAQAPVYGLWLIEELSRHDYILSPGTLYPTLHSLEQQRFLVSYKEVVGGRQRRYYTITPEGATALDEARRRLRELIDEVCTDPA